MPNTSSCAKVLLCAGLWSLLSLAASASEDRARGFYAEGGRAPHNDTSTESLTVGFIVPWTARHQVARQECATSTDGTDQGTRAAE